MLKNFKILSLIAVFVLGLATIGFAQETTGSIEVTVSDQAGARVPGATVEVVSESFRRTITTNDEGFARALQLQPGIYTVNVAAANFEPFSRNNIQVVLGLNSPVNVTLGIVGTSVEVIVGTDELPIDPTSSRIQTNLTEKELEQLPKGTNFTSALKAVPSVRSEPAAGGFSIDGATGVENSFVIDGQEVSNFRTGDLNGNNNLPFQIVRELQVKNSGFEAEFGGATGGVINVVTKSGGNDVRGQIGSDFSTEKLNANDRPILGPNPNQFKYLIPTKPEGVNFFPFASLGGPIVKNRLWFFGSASPQYYNSTRNFTFRDGSIGEYRRRQQNDYYFGRIDAAVTDNLRVYSTYTYNPIKVNGALPGFTTLDSFGTVGGPNVPNTGAVDPAALAELGGRQPASNFTINGSYVATPDLVFSARFSRGYLNEKIANYGIPNVTRFQCVTGGFNCDPGFNNVATNDRTIRDISIRKNYEADVSYILDNFGGRHQFKGGYQRFGISNDVASGYVEPGRVLFYFGRTTAAENGSLFGNRTGEVGYARLVEIGEFGQASSENEAIYVQDSWQPFSNLTLNLGFRTERESVPSFAEGAPGIEFNFSDKIAPRLGVAYDVFSNGKFKVFANFGQFFDRFKYELPRGSFGGNVFNDYRAPLLTSMPNIFSYTKDYVIANSLVFTNFRVPSNDPGDFRVEPDLKPVRQTEYTAGTQIDLGANTILGARYTHKELDDTIEDIGYHDEDGNEAYFIGNPGRGICAQSACGRYNVGAPAAVPERKYDALEIVVDKRFSSNFTVNANYTYSRLFGNYSGLASTDEYSVNGTARESPNVNRFFDTPFDGFSVGGAPNNGRLATDRPHVFKFFGSYGFNNTEDSFIRLPGSNELELSAFFTAQSGTPVSTQVDLIDNAYIFLNGRGDLGRTPTFSQTDLSATYRYRFGRDNRYSMQFNVDVLNAFNQATVTTIFQSISQANFQPADFRPFLTVGQYITDRQDFDRAFFDGRITADAIRTLNNTQVQQRNADGTLATRTLANGTVVPVFDSAVPDQRYGAGQFFQGPRNVRFGFRFNF